LAQANRLKHSSILRNGLGLLSPLLAMFCCGGKSQVQEPRRLSDFELAQRMQEREDRRAMRTGLASSQPRAENRQDWGTGATGQRLGGQAEGSEAERRQKALQAAEQRQNAPVGVSKERAAELARQRQREELLGRITEHYRRLGDDVPMGINVASVEQLRKHLDNLRSL